MSHEMLFLRKIILRGCTLAAFIILVGISVLISNEHMIEIIETKHTDTVRPGFDYWSEAIPNASIRQSSHASSSHNETINISKVNKKGKNNVFIVDKAKSIRPGAINGTKLSFSNRTSKKVKPKINETASKIYCDAYMKETRLNYTIISGPSVRENSERICITTQLTFERFSSLQQIAKYWHGKICFFFLIAILYILLTNLLRFSILMTSMGLNIYNEHIYI